MALTTVVRQLRSRTTPSLPLASLSRGGGGSALAPLMEVVVGGGFPTAQQRTRTAALLSLSALQYPQPLHFAEKPRENVQLSWAPAGGRAARWRQ